MVSSFLVKDNFGSLWGFSYNNSAIFYRQYIEGKWKENGILINSMRKYFTVNISSQGKIYVIGQSLEGDVILCSNNDGDWKSKVILKNANNSLANILFHAIIDKSEMTLLYLVDNEGIGKIFYQKISNSKADCENKIIDNALGIEESFFKVEKNKDKIILFYQKKERENQLGYRVFTLNNFSSSFIPLHKTGYKFIDTSAICFNGSDYFLYIVKSMFSTQLLFRKNTDNTLTSPTLIYEGQGISSCDIFYSKGKLYAFFIMNKQLFYAYSINDGETFSRPIRDKKYSSFNWEKAEALGFNDLEFNAKEIYVDKNKGNLPEINMIKEFFEGFYNKNNKNENRQVNESSLNRNVNDNIKNNINEFKAINAEEIKIENERLKNQLELLGKDNEQKNKQILSLNNLLQSKNKEAMLIEARLTEKIKELKEENERLKNKGKVVVKAENEGAALILFGDKKEEEKEANLKDINDNK